MKIGLEQLQNTKSAVEIEPQDVATFLMSMSFEAVKVFQSRFQFENDDNQEYYQSIYDLLSPEYQALFTPPSLSSHRLS